MKIAKIVKSNSHVDYIGRVLDRLEVATPPSPKDYRFGQFVSLPTGATKPIGIIYNSQLINPEYGRLGPRLASSPALNEVFSPDLVDEQGVLIGILLVGWMDENSRPHQGIPRDVIAVNTAVERMSEAEVAAFHRDADGRINLHYYAQTLTHARQFAPQLLLTVLDQLESLFGNQAQAELAVLRRTLNWQAIMQNKMS